MCSLRMCNRKNQSGHARHFLSRFFGVIHWSCSLQIKNISVFFHIPSFLWIKSALAFPASYLAYLTIWSTFATNCTHCSHSTTTTTPKPVENNAMIHFLAVSLVFPKTASIHVITQSLHSSGAASLCSRYVGWMMSGDHYYYLDFLEYCAIIAMKFDRWAICR